MTDQSEKRHERNGRASDTEIVVPSTGTRVPVPDDATDDDLDALVLSHPELVERAARARRERQTRGRTDLKPTPAAR